VPEPSRDYVGSRRVPANEWSPCKGDVSQLERRTFNSPKRASEGNLRGFLLFVYPLAVG